MLTIYTDDHRLHHGQHELIGGQYFHHQLAWNKKYGNPLEIKGLAKPKPPSAHKIVGKAHPVQVIND